ncbi:DMT family transporter [Roseiterribacter gracilis]|uniref:Peptide ABC transporter ATP-binding protein n=1 Tax=Roseiterribacter gracilis TaxID=2812848 RepID=A0A8S8XHL1_9PROT|nr:peptide ABC transporter ATP-binding protein [Rhodospirillales bacterium TMPK1]
MTTTPARSASFLLPVSFVALWSTGFIGAKLGLPSAGAFTFLTIRFAAVALLLALVSVVTRAPWPKTRREIGHMAVAGLLVHAIYLGGVFAAIGVGVEAGVAALICGLQPVLVAFAAGPLFGERLRPVQWIGLTLGLVGVVLVVAQKLALGLGTPAGVALVIFALLGITIGTLYQKRFCAGMDLRSGAVVQFAAATLALAPFATVLEGWRVEFTPAFIFALVWLVLVLSVGAITLLYVLIRRGAAAEVASLFFLVPPTTALMAWLLFGETLEPVSALGMATVVVGVALVNRSPRQPQN